MLFAGLIVLSLLLNAPFFLGQPAIAHSDTILISVAQACLTQIDASILQISISPLNYLFSVLITQISGIFLLSYLLFLYKKLTETGDHFHLKEAFFTTIKFSLIFEFALFLFFLYSIPLESTGKSVRFKIVSALALSVKSFNNAGLPFIDSFLNEGTIRQNYIIQIGIVAGNIIGSLGIFVIDELLNPKNLRKRLANPGIDWSPITKVTIFGALLMFLTFSTVFYFNEKNGVLSGLNITESVIASIFEISSSRGFGYTLFSESNDNLNALVTFFGAAPFSTGGGFTLLILVSIMVFFMKKYLKSMDWTILAKIGRNLFFYLFISFCFIALVYLGIFGFSFLRFPGTDLWLTLSSNQISMLPDSHWFFDLFISTVNIIGRLSFIIICFITLKQKS